MFAISCPKASSFPCPTTPAVGDLVPALPRPSLSRTPDEAGRLSAVTSRVLRVLLLVFVLLLSLPGAAHAQSLRKNDSLEEMREAAVERFSFAELVQAGDKLAENSYWLLINDPISTEDWDLLEQGYRILLALTRDDSHDGRAALLAAGIALNAVRPKHSLALATEALDLLQSQRHRDLAMEIIRRAGMRPSKEISYEMEGDLRAIMEEVALFGPTQSWATQQGDFAQLCLTFSRPLQASHRVDYRDLITVTPALPVERYVVRRDRRELCVVGAAFDQLYELTLTTGLKSAANDRLRETMQITLQTPARTPELALPGQGYMLPASGLQLVPLETVNHSQIEVGLYHLDERNINQVLRNGLLVQSTGQIEPRRIDDYDGGGDAFRRNVLPVFEGRLRVERLEHERRRDGIALAQMLGAPVERGLYMLRVRPADNTGAASGEDIKWLMISDLGLTAVKTPAGLHVTAVDTRTGTPVAENVRVDMITTGNRVLTPAIPAYNEADGHAAANAVRGTTTFFSTPQLRGRDGNRPLYLYASHPELGDAFLALDRTPIEIDTPGGLGPLNSGPLDLWLKADRGAYREGETARVAGLLQARATNDEQPLVVPDSLLATLRNPFGEVSDNFEIDLSAGQGFEVEVPLPLGARQGRWTLEVALDQDLPPLRSLILPVSEFVPPSVEITLVDPQPLRLDGSDRIEVQVDYLFGAPAQDLSVNLVASLIPQRMIGDFFVGLEQEEFVFAAPFDLVADTDEQGLVSFEIPVFNLPDQTGMAQVSLRAVVTDAAGRQERTSAQVDLADDRILLGLRPAFDLDQPVEEGANLRIDLTALTADGRSAEARTTWTLYQELYDYRWYFDGGRWNYESSYVDVPVASGTRDLTGEPTPLDLRVDWGAYRLEVADSVEGAATSLRFNAGWRALPQVGRAPGRLGLAFEGQPPRPGDSLSFSLDSPHAGTGQLYLVGSDTQVVELGAIAAGSNTLQLTVPTDWPDQEGFWLLPVVYSQGAVGIDALPARAVGAAFLSLDHSTQQLTLGVSLRDGAVALPRQPLDIDLDLGPLNPGERAYALGWIIDDGVLRMTGYDDPDPQGHFFDPFDLPVALRDTFAALISSSGLEAAALEQGYDGSMFAMRAMAAAMPEMSLAVGLTTRIKETMALSSGVQTFGTDGSGTLSFDLPDFAGRGRLLMLAWTDQGRIGAGSQSLLIRDPVVADLFLPRFLAPGDEVDVRLLVSNTRDDATRALLSLRLDDGLSLIAGTEMMTLDLEAHAQQPIPLRLGATDAIGATGITIEVQVGETTISRRFPIEVRPAAPRKLIRTSILLGPGNTATISADSLARLDNASLLLSVSGLGLDPMPLAQALADYPFRCTEQTTSRAIGLLLGGEHVLGRDALERGLREALVTLQNRQGLNGIVSLWPGSGNSDLFLQAYASDFLRLAAEKGIEGAAALRTTFVARLAEEMARAKDPYYGVELSLRTRAYGLAVLALADKPDVAAQRLLFDDLNATSGEDFAKVALALAAHAVGDTADRDALLTSLSEQPDQPIDARSQPIVNYGGILRDQLAALTLLKEGELGDLPQGAAYLAETLPGVMRAVQDNYLSTQEQAWALRLGHSLSGTADRNGVGKATVVLEGKGHLIAGDLLPLRPEDLIGGLNLNNPSPAQAGNAEATDAEADTAIGQSALVTIWQSGTDSAIDEPRAAGMDIQRTMFDLNSLQPVTNPAPGQRVLVSLFGTVYQAQSLDYVAADLLPAGFEVEQVGLPDTVMREWSQPGDCPVDESNVDETVDAGELIPTTEWMPGVCMIDGTLAFQATTVDFGESRADRVLYGFNLETGSFALYYVMRRAQGGDVIHPGAYVEAMVRPSIHARSAARQLN